VIKLLVQPEAEVSRIVTKVKVTELQVQHAVLLGCDAHLRIVFVMALVVGVAKLEAH
jgi:hypothetical protein